MDVSILALLLLTVLAMDLRPESHDITCRIGDYQSPIHIRQQQCIAYCDTNKISVGFVDMPVLFDTNTTGGLSWNHYHGSFVSVVDSDRNFIQYMGSRMVLKMPAEHTIDEKTFAAQLQLEHLMFGSLEDTPARTKCILSILFEESNTTQQSIVMSLINKTTNMAETLQPIFNNSLYYHYFGSSTEPPCKENINWYVKSQPLLMGPQEMAFLKQYYHTSTVKPKAEILQRKVYLLNSTCNMNLDFSVLRKQSELYSFYLLLTMLIILGF